MNGTNFSFFIENRSFRRDFIFNKTFGIISEIDKEYYNDDSYKLIYKCKCGDIIYQAGNPSIYENLSFFARDKNILELLNDFDNKDNRHRNRSSEYLYLK